MERFGAIVKRLRLQRDEMSLRELARRAHINAGHLSRIENSARPPSDATAAALDNALGANGELCRAAEGNRTGLASVSPMAHDLEVVGSDVSDYSEHGEVIPADRRAFMQVAAGVALAMGAGPSRHVDPGLIGYFRQQLDGHYAADMMLGPRALIETVGAQCRLIGGLIDGASGSTKRGMAQIGVSFATFSAWLHLDAGDVAAALRWHDVAQEWAYRSRDREAVACALVDRAMARTDLNAGSAVVDLCEAALIDSGRVSPEVRVFALQQRAHGASLLGDRAAVDRLLDTAASVLRSVDEEAWGTACLRTPHYVEVQRATCYGRLGLAAEAERIWVQVLPTAPAAARRDVGVWAARRAGVAAAAGEPERAVELSRQAVSIALDTGSARARRELAAVSHAMTPWQAEPIGQELAQALAPITGRA